MTANSDTPDQSRHSTDEEYEEAVRQTAYFLWEQDGKPEGQANTYWLRAQERHARQRDYDAWLGEGSSQERAGDDAERGGHTNRPEG